ncbi:MAG: glycosyltransferase family 2 protein [Verrucomicrobiota bacterium]
MNAAKVPVSILIPIKNEAANLPRCLAAVAWAEQIVVVDSQSTDGSIAIAEAQGAEVVQFAFNGVWPKKKNWALDHVPFRHPWVFILDADEVLPETARAEIGAIVAADGAGHAGYWINRRFMFMGEWLRHSYYPNWNLRLFRHVAGRYERLVEGATGSGDNEVHEHIVVQGTTARLRFEMDHFAFPSIHTFVEKHNRYSNWEAQLASESGLARTGALLQDRAAGWRRFIKRAVRQLPFRPTLRFLYVYVAQGGFLDGRRGFYFARLHAVYEFLAVAKTAELRLARQAAERPRPPAGHCTKP